MSKTKTLTQIIDTIEEYVHEYGFVNFDKSDISDENLKKLKEDYNCSENNREEYIFTNK